MSDHVSEDIVDYVEGRLPSWRATAVRDHLSTCADCASEHELADRIYRTLLADGRRHLGDARIVAVADDGTGVLSETEAAHFRECAWCRERHAWAASRPEPDDRELSVPERKAAEPTSRRAVVLPWSAGAAVAGLAAAALWLLFVAPEDAIDGAAHARIAPLPLRAERSAPPDSAAASYQRAVSRYLAGEYAAALAELERADELGAHDVEVDLLRGSTELLLGNAAAAIPALERVPERARTAGQADEAHWQLANAYLAAGRLQEAIDLLEQLSGSSRTADASELLAELRAAGAP